MNKTKFRKAFKRMDKLYKSYLEKSLTLDEYNALMNEQRIRVGLEIYHSPTVTYANENTVELKAIATMKG